jgi:uncharacterized protein
MEGKSPALTRFQVSNARGEKLVCVLDPPRASAASVAVLVHGFRDTKDGPCISSVAAELSSRGVYRCLRFDCHGNGESEGAFQFSNYRDEVEDLRAVVEHVRGALGLTVSCVVGHSKGAGVVLLYAAKYGDVARVVSLAARFLMEVGVEERFGGDVIREVNETGGALVTLKDGFQFRLSKESLEERLNLDMAAVARGIPPAVHVLLLHGADDRTIPFADAERFDEVIATSTLSLVPDCNHNFRGHATRIADEIEKLAL